MNDTTNRPTTSAEGPPRGARSAPSGGSAAAPAASVGGSNAEGPSRRARSALSGGSATATPPTVGGSISGGPSGGAAATPASMGGSLSALAAEVDAWEKNEVAKFVARAPERAAEFSTIGGFPVKRTYTALDVADTPLDDI